MLWKVKDNSVQSGSEPVDSTRSLALSLSLSRSVPTSVLQLSLSHHLCLSVTHAHIHRSFSLTHLNAVSLFLSPSVGGTRCGAGVWAHPRWDKLRCFDGSAISALLCPTAGAQAFTLSRSSLNLREKIYILYLTDTSPWAGWNSTLLEYRPTCYYLFNALTERRRRRKQMAERRREM